LSSQYKTIGQLSWSAADNEETGSVESMPSQCPDISNCDDIILSEGECINGHRVAFDASHVYNIELITSKNQKFSCGNGLKYGDDSGFIRYESSCLTGLQGKSDYYMKAIQFQYTKQEQFGVQPLNNANDDWMYTTNVTRVTGDDQPVVVKTVMPDWWIWITDNSMAIIVGTVVAVCCAAAIMARIVYKCMDKKNKTLDDEVSSITDKLVNTERKPKKSLVSTMNSEYSSIDVSTKTKNHMLKVTNVSPALNNGDTILGITSPKAKNYVEL